MNSTQETLDLIKAAMAKPDADLAKAWTQSGSAVSGITAYDLEAPAKLLYPVLTPIRNITPRVSGKGGIQANWRGVTGINTTNLPVGRAEGKRAGTSVTTTADYLAVYRAIGLEDTVTWEADYAAENFQDLKALAVMQLLRATMIAEERVILGGLGTWALTRTPTPTVTPVGTGGTCSYAHDPFTVYCIALTRDGYARATLASIPQTITRTNTDATTDSINGGSARVSIAQTASCGGSVTTGSFTCTVTAVPGAVAYAWLWGGTNTADKLLGAITTTNAYTITTDVPTGTVAYSTLSNSADFSQDSLVFDGLLSLAAKTSSGSYIKSLDNAVLTSSGDGGITEIDAALASFWDNYRLSPDAIWVSSQEMKNIRAKIMTAASTGAQRFVFNVAQGKITGGSMAVSYLNPFSMNGIATEIPIELHPDMPPGTMLFTTKTLPYPLSNVSNVWQMKLRYDYRQMEWPMTKPRYEYGVYFDGVLQHYFTPALGVISNIKNG